MIGIGLGLTQTAIGKAGPAVLGTLGVNPASITENSAPGAIVGAITGGKPGSTITITGTAGSRFAISGGNVVAGATNTDYETATSYDITLRETNAAYPNSPKDTVITIAVADVNTLLSALTLSAASMQENSAAGTVVGTIQNTSGGTITITDTAGGRFALGTGGDTGKVVAGATNTDYETATSYNITLTETLGESSNSPRNTVLAIAITDQAVEGPTYAQFQAHIATLATDGVGTWAGQLPQGARRVTAATATGSMNGSPWQANGFDYDFSTTCRVIQHSLPSEAVFLDQIANGREIFVRVSSLGGTTQVFAVARNNYTSAGRTDEEEGIGNFKVEEVIYYDGTQARRMTPESQGGPTLYTI